MPEFLFSDTLWPEDPLTMAGGINTVLREHLEKLLVQHVSRKEEDKHLCHILEVQEKNSVWLYQPCNECRVALSPR